jgi:hypothetical protein
MNNATTNTSNANPFVAPFSFHFGHPSYKLADVMESLGFPTACTEESLETVEGFDSEMFFYEYETDARGYETFVATVSREGLNWIHNFPGAASAAAWVLAESLKTERECAAYFMEEYLSFLKKY